MAKAPMSARRAPGKKQTARAGAQNWLEQQLARVSTKSVIAEVIRYGLNHWGGLVRFLDDGRIELDTNIVERSIRPIVTNESLYTSRSSVCKHWDLFFESS